MKTYIDAELQIICMDNDIVTSSIKMGVNNNTTITDPNAVGTPGRRSIWD
ncbi:MAG: hypothetical protein IKN59_06640 [Paludibacteraceae bacterium]|nr:hypothetical protein [Paludibacteraceae bacterium]